MWGHKYIYRALYVYIGTASVQINNQSNNMFLTTHGVIQRHLKNTKICSLPCWHMRLLFAFTTQGGWGLGNFEYITRVIAINKLHKKFCLLPSLPPQVGSVYVKVNKQFEQMHISWIDSMTTLAMHCKTEWDCMTGFMVFSSTKVICQHVKVRWSYCFCVLVAGHW